MVTRECFELSKQLGCGEDCVPQNKLRNDRRVRRDRLKQ